MNTHVCGNEERKNLLYTRVHVIVRTCVVFFRTSLPVSLSVSACIGQKLASQVDISEVQKSTCDAENAGSTPKWYAEKYRPSMAIRCVFRTGSAQIAPQASG